MRKGDIVLVEFPYTDLVTSKLRPSVVLLETRFDLIVCFITSNLKIKEPCDLILSPTSLNNLKVISLLKANKIMTIDKAIVKGKLGQLSLNEISVLNKNITKLLHLK